jgi:hypothetical protein
METSSFETNATANSAFAKRAALIGVLLLAIVTAVMARNLNLPNPKPIINFDEAVYGGLAFELAETGNYTSRRIFPDGLRDSGDAAVVHTMLSPYLQAAAIQWLGFDRVALRLHSLVLYAASGGVLLLLVARMGLPPLQAVAALSLFFLSPWLIYAGTIGRSESIGMFLVFAATLVAWILRKREIAGVFASGFIAGAAVYNHATFLAAACLPYLFCLRFREGKASVVKTAPAYAAGALVAIAALWLWLMLPHYEAWRDEFVAAGASAWAGPSLTGVPLAMKHLFSTFGAAYLNWYLTGFLFLLVVLKPTRYSILGILWMAAFMAYLLMKMGMVMNYCVQFAVGMPILALLSGSPRFVWSSNKLVVALLAIFLGVQVPWNAWRVTAENPWTREAHQQELSLSGKLAELEPGQAVIGDEVTGFAILRAGHRYFHLGDNWAFSPEQRVRFDRLCRDQATYEATQNGDLIASKPSAHETRGADD